MLRLQTHVEVGKLSGGAAIEVLATHGNPSSFTLPHIMSRRFDLMYIIIIYFKVHFTLILCSVGDTLPGVIACSPFLG